MRSDNEMFIALAAELEAAGVRVRLGEMTSPAAVAAGVIALATRKIADRAKMLPNGKPDAYERLVIMHEAFEWALRTAARTQFADTAARWLDERPRACIEICRSGGGLSSVQLALSHGMEHDAYDGKPWRLWVVDPDEGRFFGEGETLGAALGEALGKWDRRDDEAATAE